MKKKHTKKIAAGLSVVLLIALIVGGSLAWQDISQHKTNTFKQSQLYYNAVLIENFKEEENWIKDVPVKKNISVRNGQKDDNTEDFDFGNIYVRLQFKEYLGSVSSKYIYSDNRYMIDTSGNFIKKETESELKDWMRSHDVPNDARIEKAKDYFDTQEYYYIATQEADINGQYGKFLVLDIEEFDETSIVTGQTNHSDASKNEHQEIENSEDNYVSHLWSADTTGYSKTSAFTEFVSWKLGDNVIPIDAWDGNPVSKWILDTSSAEGWAYWGNTLSHSTEDTSLNSQTSDILESVTLIKNHASSLNYSIHINLDAISYSDIDLWQDAPQDITDAYKTVENIYISKQALQDLVDEVQKIDLSASSSEKAVDLAKELEKSINVLNDPSASKEEIESQHEALDKALQEYLRDIDLQLKNELNEIIIKAQEKDRVEKQAQTVEKLDEELEKALAVQAKQNSTHDEIRAAIERLETALSRVVNDKLLGFANHDWDVLHVDEEGHVLIVSETLEAEDFTKMGMSADVSPKYIFFHKNATPSTIYAPGYKESKLKTVDQAFFDTFIANDSEALKAVLPITFKEEVGQESTYTQRTDGPTLVSENGVKTAFSLSVSDINYYKLRALDLDDVDDQFWLRSPGQEKRSAAYVNRGGILSHHYMNNTTTAVAPALWLDLEFVDIGQEK